MTEPGVALDAVRSAVRAALRVEEGLDGAWQQPEVLADEAFLAAVARHRVAEVLHRNADGLALPAGLREGVRRQRDVNAVNALRALRLAALLQDGLTAAEVPSLVFKGTALAMQTTGDPMARGFGDIDLLVAPHTLDRVLDVAETVGLRNGHRLPADGAWARRYWQWSTYEVALQGEVDVDLHWRLDFSHRSLPTFEQAWESRTRVGAGASALVTLSVLDALRHSCVHAAKDDWRWLRSLVDVHRLTRHPDLPADWRLCLTPVQRRTVALTEHLLGSPTPAREVGGRTLSRAERSQASEPPPVTQEVLVPIWRDAARQLAKGDPRPSTYLRALVSVAVPPVTALDLPDTRARTAVPRVLALRTQDLAHKLRTRLARRRGTVT